MRPWPNKSPEPTAVGAGRSAVAVHVASRRGSAFLVRPHRVFGFCRAVFRCGGLVGSQI